MKFYIRIFLFLYALDACIEYPYCTPSVDANTNLASELSVNSSAEVAASIVDTTRLFILMPQVLSVFTSTSPNPEYVVELDTTMATADDAASEGNVENISPSNTTGYVGGESYIPARYYMTAYRFALDIPQGASIDTCDLTFYVGNDFSGPITTADSILISAYNVDNCDVFSSAHTHALDAHHPLASITKTHVSPQPGVDNYTAYTITGLASMLQSIIKDRSGWVSGNYAGFVVQPKIGAWTIDHYFNIFDRDANGGLNTYARIRVVYHTNF